MLRGALRRTTVRCGGVTGMESYELAEKAAQPHLGEQLMPKPYSGRWQAAIDEGGLGSTPGSMGWNHNTHWGRVGPWNPMVFGRDWGKLRNKRAFQARYPHANMNDAELIMGMYSALIDGRFSTPTQRWAVIYTYWFRRDSMLLQLALWLPAFFMLFVVVIDPTIRGTRARGLWPPDAPPVKYFLKQIGLYDDVFAPPEDPPWHWSKAPGFNSVTILGGDVAKGPWKSIDILMGQSPFYGRYLRWSGLDQYNWDGTWAKPKQPRWTWANES